MTNASQETAELPVSRLAKMAAPYNPRRISDHDLEALRRSLRSFGAVQPIVINRRTERIVGGHQRVKAARAEKIATLPVVYVDLDEAGEKQLNLAMNRISGEWDDGKLSALLAELKEEGADLQITGFEDGELTRLLGMNGGGLTDPDATPEPPAVAVTRPGDLWLLGEHRLVCGDATEKHAVASVVEGALADTVTDPPYGIGYEYASHDDSNSAANDTLIRAAFQCAPGAKVWTCGMSNLARELAHYPKAKVLVWHKGFARAGNGLGGANTWEPVVVVGVRSGRLPDDYLHFGTDRVPGLREKHSCPKPVKLYTHLIEHLTGRAVYDPFVGSGTTLIAAEQLDRRCFAMEIEPRYCDVTIERWQNFTGNAAVLEESSEPFGVVKARRSQNGDGAEVA